MPLFETKSKMRMISAHKRVTALKFGTAVSFVKNNMELCRNGGETAAPTDKPPFPAEFFFAFLAIIDHIQSSEINFIFS